jgi:hypothetical protein
MRVEIRAIDRSVMDELIPGYSSEHKRASEQDGIRIGLLDEPRRGAFGVAEIIKLSIDFGASVSAAVVSQWLYDKIKGRSISVTIDKMEVDVSEDAIRKVVEKCLDDKSRK